MEAELAKVGGAYAGERNGTDVRRRACQLVYKMGKKVITSRE